MPKKKPPSKNDNVSLLQNTGSQKKRFVATPLLTKQIGVFELVFFLKPNTLMLNKKHNLKSGEKKTNIRERDLKEKTRQETKKEKRFMKKNFVIEYFDVVLFMKQKQRKMKRRRERQRKRN